ncbi:MAG: hypothetical protein ABR530_10920 [Pyrinomonadaceae bacterium]
MKGLINGVISVICLVLAGWCFYKYGQTTPANTMYMIGAIVFALAMVIFGVMFLSGRVNKTEDIHITE